MRLTRDELSRLRAAHGARVSCFGAIHSEIRAIFRATVVCLSTQFDQKIDISVITLKSASKNASLPLILYLLP